MKAILRAVVSGAAIGGVLVLTGCAMFRQKVEDKDVSNMPDFDATYGAKDLRNLSDKVATSIATSYIFSLPGLPPPPAGIKPGNPAFFGLRAWPGTG